MTENPLVISADVLDAGVRLTFADGKSGLYPHALLYSLLPQAEAVPEGEVKAEFN